MLNHKHFKESKPDWKSGVFFLLILLAVIIIIIITFGIHNQAHGQVGDKSLEGNIKLDSTISTDKIKNRALTARIGNAAQLNFKPELNLSAWKNECSFTLDMRGEIGATMSSVTKVIHNGADKVMMTQDATIDNSIYKRDDGNLEWEIVLKKKPDTNVFQYEIQTHGLEFLYQPTAIEVPFAVGEYRPDSVEGSYAVYHATKANDFVRIRGKDTTCENYQTGKAFHIYRPKVIDKNGKEAWCILYIDTLWNELSITVPQKFLDDAKYPVIVDPTFGFSTEGGSEYGLEKCFGNREAAYQFSTGGTDYQIIAFHLYAYEPSSTGSVGMAVYTVSGVTPVSRNAAAETITISPWYEFEMHEITGLTQALSRSTTYTVCVGNEVENILMAKDNITEGTSYQFSSANLEASWDEQSLFGYRFSMWTTYEESGEPPEEAPARRRRILQTLGGQ